MKDQGNLLDSMTGSESSANTKAPNAYRTISEAAREIGVETHVLRFWETKFPQLQPNRLAGGRRSYRPEDMTVLRTICKLLHEDKLTISGAQAKLKQERRQISAIPAKMKQELLQELHSLQKIIG